MKMEWPEDHDIQLAKDVLVSEPYRFKPRAVYARLYSRKNCEACENLAIRRL